MLLLIGSFFSVPGGHIRAEDSETTNIRVRVEWRNFRPEDTKPKVWITLTRDPYYENTVRFTKPLEEGTDSVLFENQPIKSGYDYYTYDAYLSNEAGEPLPPETIREESRPLQLYHFRPPYQPEYVLPMNIYSTANETSYTVTVKTVNVPRGEMVPYTIGLFRKTEGTSWEYLPDRMPSNGYDSLTWYFLEKTNAENQPYTYAAFATDEEGHILHTIPFHSVTYDNNTITFTRHPEKVSPRGKKYWSGGGAHKPTIYVKLVRASLENIDVEDVPGAPILKLENGETEYGWTDIDGLSPDNYIYTFGVVEVDSQGNPFVPYGYRPAPLPINPGPFLSMDLHNLYTPLTGDVTAHKVWVNAPDLKPDVYFALFRQSGSEDPEYVYDAPVLRLPEGKDSVTWKDIRTHDWNGNPYTFSVREVDKNGYSYTPQNYTKLENGLTVTNTYNAPSQEDDRIHATKIWSGGPELKPDIWFRLMRKTADGVSEEVPGAELMRLTGGTTSVTWYGIDKKDAQNRPYTFFVHELNERGEHKAPENYRAEESGLIVKNTYVPKKTTSFTATKEWVGGSAPRPTVWFQLLRSVNHEPVEVVPDAEKKELPNGTLSVTWEGLDDTDFYGVPYHYMVQEVNESGSPGAPEHYRTENNGPNHVVNTYHPPTRTIRAKKIWKNAGFYTPKVYFELRRKNDKGIDEPVPNNYPQQVPESGFVFWTNIDTEDLEGNPYSFYVKEVNELGEYGPPEHFISEEDGLTITNTYQPPRGEITARKTWVDGPEDHPVTYFRLHRRAIKLGTIIDPGSEIMPDPRDMISYHTDEPVPGAPIKALVNNSITATWPDIELMDPNQVPYNFYVTEVDSEGNPSVPKNYTVSLDPTDPLHLINTYIVPNNHTVRAEKIWNGGAYPKPTIYFKLYRSLPNGDPEEVPNTGILPLPSGTTSVEWTGLDGTALNGQAYTFSVREVDAQGNPLTLPEYSKEENGVLITNTYLPPKTDVTAHKEWVGGPEQKPDVYFKLFRRASHTQDPAIAGSPASYTTDEAVPGADLLCLKSGTSEGTWKNIDAADRNAATYSFYVKEADANGTPITNLEHYKVSTRPNDPLTIVNTYVIPTGSIEARKSWVHGPAKRPEVFLTLYRNLSSGQKERVPNTSPLSLGENKELVTWENLELTTFDGKPYIFTVEETDSTGNSFVPQNYESKAEGLTITNTYIVPKDGVAEATKTWVDGPSEHPTVWFKLYRKILDPSSSVNVLLNEEVPGAELKKLENGVTSVRWTGLERTDLQGREYIFYVRETNEAGEDSTPQNYSKNEDGLNVTNSYVIPKDVTVEATKTWVNGSAEKPEIFFKLYRTGANGKEEAVQNAELKRLPSGTISVRWDMLDRTDINGFKYTYSVKETDKNGVVGSPENYDSVNLTRVSIQNTYVVPKNQEALAKKIWVGGDKNRPDIYLKLFRKTKTMEEAVPNLSPVLLSSGQTEHRWTGLEGTTLSGEAYTFFVRETDANGNPLNLPNYEKKEEGLTVTNTYIIPENGSVKASKHWIGGPTEKPSIYFTLYRRNANTEAERVPNAKIKELSNGTTSVEWSGLQETDSSALPYEFFVKETDKNGLSFTPESYEKEEQGLTVTNTFVRKTGDVVANLVWVGGPEKKPTVHFRLYRALKEETNAHPYSRSSSPKEAVPEAELRRMEDGTLSTVWKNQFLVSDFGAPYEFFVQEVDEQGKDYTPEGYRKEEKGLTVTNYYLSTPEPTTPEPTTPEPTVPEPTTPEPTVPKPTVPKPTVPKPTVPRPTVPRPTVPAPIPEPTTPEPTTPEPTVPRPTVPKPTVPRPTVPAPTPEPTTPEPTVPKPTVPKPTVPRPTVPAPTPEPTTPEPTTPEPTTPEPTVPKPTVPKPTVPKPTVPKPTVPKPTAPKPTVPVPTPEPTTPRPTLPHHPGSETGDRSLQFYVWLMLFSGASLLLLLTFLPLGKKSSEEEES